MVRRMPVAGCFPGTSFIASIAGSIHSSSTTAVGVEEVRISTSATLNSRSLSGSLIVGRRTHFKTKVDGQDCDRTTCHSDENCWGIDFKMLLKGQYIILVTYDS
jgi:hypothetical protein